VYYFFKAGKYSR